MASKLDPDRVYSRRSERTFAGSHCVVCDEPLEHMLRGEHMLQLSCAHVAHEACFYEYIRHLDSRACPECGAVLGLDSGRGGNVVDIDKLSNIVRSLQVAADTAEGPEKGPVSQASHARNKSDGSSKVARASLGPTKDDARIATNQEVRIPPPKLSIQSEYPTINRTKQPQSLTCLVTVEVPDHHPLEKKSKSMESKLKLVESMQTLSSSRDAREDEELQRVTEELHSRVDNWHGLDFSRFGPLRLHNKLQVGKDRQSWQELECYLFAQMLICVKEKKSTDSTEKRRSKATLKGSIMIKKHLDSIETLAGDKNLLTLHLSVPELPMFHLQFPNHTELQTWRLALDNPDGLPEETEKGLDSRMSQASEPIGLEVEHSPPVNIVVVIPPSPSMHGIKHDLLRDSLRFLLDNLDPSDKLGLVVSGLNFESVGLQSKAWPDWPRALEALSGTPAKGLDMTDGTAAAIDMLLRNPLGSISSILLISDSATEAGPLDSVISRAEAARISVNTFGLGLNHKPDALTELSMRTGGTYTFVKDWMMLQDCIGGCLCSLQSTTHIGVSLRLHLPESSHVRFSKVTGARVSSVGSDLECNLGDLGFGDRRDILVQLTVSPQVSSTDTPRDAWDTMVSTLEALGDDPGSSHMSVDELPILQAGLSFSDFAGSRAVSRPSLLAITVLASKNAQSVPIPPQMAIVQRRMELLVSDMLSRALTLVSKGQHDKADRLLRETRSVIKSLANGGLPIAPIADGNQERLDISLTSVEAGMVRALDAELESTLEWINHPTVFMRDSRKVALQAIGIINTQRAFTFRSELEAYMAKSKSTLRIMADKSRTWQREDAESVS